MSKKKKNKKRKTKTFKKVLKKGPKNEPLKINLVTNGKANQTENPGQIKIKVIGVGGAGCNVVSRMYSKIKGVEFVALNTDFQSLRHSRADKKVFVGKNVTHGLGAGMDPELGQRAFEENEEEVNKILANTDLVFLTCGLGGGTGSGISPQVAELAKRNNALVIAIVTKPFSFEGGKRMEIADNAWNRLEERVDAIITIYNDRVFNLIDRDTSILKAFGLIDDILRQAVSGIYDLIVYPGLINIDYNNIKAIMSGAGKSLIGIGAAKGEKRALKAAEAAIKSPLLDLSIEGATRVLFNISGPSDLSLVEVNEVARLITESVDKNAKVVFGAVYDRSNKEKELKVIVLAGGFGGESGLHFATKLPLEIKTETKLPERENIKINSPPEKDDLEKELEIPAFLKKKK